MSQISPTGASERRRVPLHVTATRENARYLDTKRRRMGHHPPVADGLDAASHDEA